MAINFKQQSQPQTQWTVDLSSQSLSVVKFFKRYYYLTLYPGDRVLSILDETESIVVAESRVGEDVRG